MFNKMMALLGKVPKPVKALAVGAVVVIGGISVRQSGIVPKATPMQLAVVKAAEMNRSQFDHSNPYLMHYTVSLGSEADGQFTAPGTTGLGTTVDLALAGTANGLNFLSATSIQIALLLLGLAVLGGLWARARFRAPK